MTEPVRDTEWIIEEYAEGEPVEQVSCRPVDDPEADEPRFLREPTELRFQREPTERNGEDADGRS